MKSKIVERRRVRGHAVRRSCRPQVEAVEARLFALHDCRHYRR